jgi:AraC-like DNA-binding protein
MDQVRERPLNGDISYARFTPPSYVPANLTGGLGSAQPSAVAEQLSLPEMLMKKLTQVSDHEIGTAYRDVLNAVEIDRRRRTLERSRHAYEAVLNWIDANVATSLDIEDVSRGSRQSVAAIRRLVREHTNQSIASFIRGRRIAAALVLLTTSGKRLSLIAAECGFASQSHFSRSIRAETGITPSQYRKRNTAARA